MTAALNDLPGLRAAATLLVLAWVLARMARPLARAQWTSRAPGLGVLAWQGISLGMVLSVVLAGVALLVPHATAATSLGELVRLCTEEVLGHTDEPLVQLPALAGFVVVAALVARFGWLSVLNESRSRGRRSRQRATVDAIGSRAVDGLVVVDHEVPAVYCVPGRRPRIVATTAATQLLSAAELHSVLAHERAHLQLRHHLAVAVAQMLSSTLPWAHGFRLGAVQVSRLVEMQADDAAGRAARPDLAHALVRLALGPQGALSAGGDTAARARRLLTPSEPLRPAARAAVVVLSATAVAAPVLLAMLPGGEALAHACCDYRLG